MDQRRDELQQVADDCYARPDENPEEKERQIRAIRHVVGEEGGDFRAHKMGQVVLSVLYEIQEMQSTIVLLNGPCTISTRLTNTIRKCSKHYAPKQEDVQWMHVFVISSALLTQ